MTEIAHTQMYILNDFIHNSSCTTVPFFMVMDKQ